MDDFSDDLAAISRLDVVPKILEVITRTTGMGFAAVARVTEDRWVACAVRDEIGFGLEPGGELAVRTTLCDEIRRSGQPVIIDHVTLSPAFRDHPTPAQYGFQSYISVPILHRGAFFGALCAIDPRPARLETAETRGMFELFAQLIGSHLDARQAAELRDQFIAVLGHDLRNPLASIAGGARLIAKTPLNERAETMLALMQGSVQRMAGLIDNVVDFARGRLGGGFVMERRPDCDLGKTLIQVVDELRTAHPHREIETDIALDRPVDCDSKRLAQLTSNLLANALTHGAETLPVRLEASTAANTLTLSVINHGEPIPAAAMDQLFMPFTRAMVRPSLQGLGLGLYIAAQIAQAHGGRLDVVSDEAETRFTFRMPLEA